MQNLAISSRPSIVINVNWRWRIFQILYSHDMASTKAQKSSGGHVNPRLTKDGHLCKYSRTPLSRTERRYVMLTEAHLHWYGAPTLVYRGRLDF